MSGELISVIIPAYNHEAFIEKALESCAAQTYGNMELVVIDDCSTDATFAKAEAFLQRPEMAQRFARIILQKNSVNIGAAETINAGLKLAQGQWLTILNSDDCYMPQRFEHMLFALNNAGKQAGFSNLMLIDDDGKEIVFHELAMTFRALPERVSSWPGMGFHILMENIAITSGNLIFSRSMYEKTGNFASLKLTHDWDYLIRLLAWEEPLFVAETLYQYRLHEANAHRGMLFEKYFDTLVVYERYLRAIACGNFADPLYPCYGGRRVQRQVEGKGAIYLQTLADRCRLAQA